MPILHVRLKNNLVDKRYATLIKKGINTKYKYYFREKILILLRSALSLKKKIFQFFTVKTELN